MSDFTCALCGEVTPTAHGHGMTDALREIGKQRLLVEQIKAERDDLAAQVAVLADSLKFFSAGYLDDSWGLRRCKYCQVVESEDHASFCPRTVLTDLPAAAKALLDRLEQAEAREKRLVEGLQKIVAHPVLDAWAQRHMARALLAEIDGREP